jgi:leucine dehydrogenase
VHARKTAQELGARYVSPDEIMRVKADIFSPCALGAILDDISIAALDVAAVAGGANNQLARPVHAEALHARGILYAPDYVINAGGIINVALGYLGLDGTEEKIRSIPNRLEMIWVQARTTGDNPAATADRMAQALIGRG